MTGMEMLASLLSSSTSDQRDRVYGVVIGVVTNNQDPEKLGRVKVKFPWLSDQDESYWARVLTLMAGAQGGIYCLPQVDDEVLVAFEQGVIEFPYILGSLWNGKDKPPEFQDQDKRAIKSKSGHIIRLNDTQGDEKIEVIDSSGKNHLIISTKDNSIAIAADADITIQSNKGKLKLSGNGIEISSQAAIKIEATQTLDVQAGPQVNIKGQIVNIN